ncbi:hypothetical protein SRABI96_01493 [Peribacillus sp. Bi96]|uniref:amidohydrolase family protein n=1 Tax=Peribacillus sp. Bi96 TaxID=2884273 RepID=UPI001D7E5188|nr:amidohydrolase family protein [Peribacillus sp. Bi96]CAH0183538.1 hypothetical protein SRABI96_01493 [Peribacillus sp. Bi96]
MGTIESGKLADIIVLDKNLFTIPADQILQARVELTFMDGQQVWCRNGTVEVTYQYSEGEVLKTSLPSKEVGLSRELNM